MADTNEEEKFFFRGEKIECKNEFPSRDCFLTGGYWIFNYDKLNFVHGFGGKIRKEALIRRIRKADCLDEWERMVTKFKKSNNKDKYFDRKIILQIFAHEDGKDEWRYFALEPYISTLYDYCRDYLNGQYEGPPLPSEPQVIDHMISGIKYLHNLHYHTHGDLNPLNIIISRDGRVKLSDFGLSKFSYTRKSDQPDDLSIKIPEICRRKYWLKWTSGQDNSDERNYELVNSEAVNVFPTEEADIFAMGCLIVYFLTKGAVHPFGDDLQAIENNLRNNNPINLEKLSKEHSRLYSCALSNMIRQPINKPKWWREAIKQFEETLLLKIYKHEFLGQGSFGKVYKGKYEGGQVAVKEIKIKNESRKSLIEREITEHTKLDHENVLKLLWFNYDDKSMYYLVLELCAGTLTDFCEMKYKGPMPPDGIVLYQIANGLHYIHSQNLVHRDVKPDNILIFNKATTTVQMKLSDLGFAKQTKEGCYSQSEIRGTPIWMAPEILAQLDSTSPLKDEETVQTDTFSTGCVFFYFLTRGWHPFNKEKKIVKLENLRPIKNNMIKNEPVGIDKQKEHLPPMFYELICKMIGDKENRIKLPEVIKQLTTNLSASRQFKRVVRSVQGGVDSVNRFHPTKLVIACGVDDKVILFSAENSSIPFSNWKKDENKFQCGNIKRIKTMKWNVDGTQLAAVCNDSRDVIVWSYPDGKILFQSTLPNYIPRIEWNPFRPNVFADFELLAKQVFFYNSSPADQRTFHFYTIEREKVITSVQWISENRVALGLWKGGGIEIYEINESRKNILELVKQFKDGNSICDMVWDERMKCLAACSLEGCMTIWSIDNDQQPIHTTKTGGRCWSLAWRPYGEKTAPDNFILSGGLDDGWIVIWSPLLEKEKTRFLNQNSRGVFSLSFSPDGRFLASADMNGKFVVWSAENWDSVFIGDNEERWGFFLSWTSPSTADFPDYKLTFNSFSGKVHVVEYAVTQNEIPIKDGSNVTMVIAKERETRGERSLGSSDPVAI